MKTAHSLLSFVILLMATNVSAKVSSSTALGDSGTHELKEQVFLTFDKTAYFQGDTIRYSANVSFNTNDSVMKSQVLYVELISPSGAILQTQKLKIKDGRCSGALALCNRMFSQDSIRIVPYLNGIYRVISYTRLMLGQSDESFFCREIPVFKPGQAEVPVTLEKTESEMKTNHTRKNAFSLPVENGLLLDGWVVNKNNAPVANKLVSIGVYSENHETQSHYSAFTDNLGYWKLSLPDFSGFRDVSLSIQVKKKNKRGEKIILARPHVSALATAWQNASHSQNDGDEGMSDGFIGEDENGKRKSHLVGYHAYDALLEMEKRLDQGRDSKMSVLDFLKRNGYKVSVDYTNMSYDPYQPIASVVPHEEDYGDINSAIARLDRTSTARLSLMNKGNVATGAKLNGNMTNWKIKVPQSFPAEIYEKEIARTWDVDMNYVKFIFVFDYVEGTTSWHEVWVIMRDAKEIRMDTLQERHIKFSGFTPANES